MSDVTRILAAAQSGDPAAAADLLPHVYAELRHLAAAKLAAERPGQTLQATALVHEAYLRLLGPAGDPGWDGRGHFFAAAAEAMRRILVERARSRGRLKRGGDRDRVDLADHDPVATAEGEAVDVLALDEVLTRFAGSHPETAELVKLRFFAGMTVAEAAAALGISDATAERRWQFARAWLARALGS